VPRNISILTVGRSDFGRYRPVLNALKNEPDVAVQLIASGSHYAAEFGTTINEIAESGFDWEPGFEMTPVCNTPAGIGKSIGFSATKIAQTFSTKQPDLLVVLGDRFEMLAGAITAMGFNIPVAHIHGGAVTEGAIDELVRHALTKMSHLHLVSCDQYAKRVCQMGEEKWRVHVTGAPGLDELSNFTAVSHEQIKRWLGFDLTFPFLLVCLHPVTVESQHNIEYVESLIAALDQRSESIVLTYPNADPGSHEIINAFEAFAAEKPNQVNLFKNMGTNVFNALLNNAAALVGNSSSGIVEAATFQLPVVNIGTRQDGKVKPKNVIDCDYGVTSIGSAIDRALNPTFRCSLSDLINPYGDGNAGSRIAKILAKISIDDRLLRKKFVDK